MNSVFILILCLFILYFLGYLKYSKYLEKKICQPDKDRKTPAYTKYDGLEYIPAKTPLLFGHHFSNIAGAGPILGPIIAISLFGWLPALLWIVLGVILIGAVHDYLTLYTSMRNDGLSIGTISQKVISKNTKIIFSTFLLLSLILIVAVFGITSSQTLVEKPDLVIPTFGIIPLAIIVGFLVYNLRISLWIVSPVAVVLFCLLIYLGIIFPISLPDKVFGLEPVVFWLICMFMYGLIASLFPVGLLDQPRDYISTFVLFIGTLLGIVSIIIARPQIQAPAFISFSSKQGPIWPMLFILIACGAISGFHALVSSGTTAKQLNNEIWQRPVGYGGMLLEGIVSIMTILIVSSALYWSATSSHHENYSFLHLIKNKTWIITFGTGYGKSVSDAFPFIPFAISSLFAMLMLNAFILTTLDTAVRLGRYITQETFGEYYNIFKSRTLTTFVVILPAFFLAVTNSWKFIWPVFGSANQLIAALTLIVITLYLVKLKKPSAYTLIPAIFMTATTLGALVYLIFSFLVATPRNIMLAIVSGILVILALFVIHQAIKTFINISLKKNEH